MNREIAGFEALLRWKHPLWGRVSPLEFIPIAERTGLIVPIGDWVIEEVCRQAMVWNNAAAPSFKIFANISGVQLARPNFSSKIAEALERSGLAPDRLELEITESWFISDLRGAAGKLQKLRDLALPSTTSVPATRRSATFGRYPLTPSKSIARSSIASTALLPTCPQCVRSPVWHNSWG
jgi:EAL domain-containing protein (putative c-di-GMP-specific phosphodiesterase class I)